MEDSSRSQPISTQRQERAEQASAYPERGFTTLIHRIDEAWLKEAQRRTNKQGAAGEDGVRAKEQEANLDENLQELLGRRKSGRYKAPPVERVWLDKEDGRKRPIGKPTIEDKNVQRAVVRLMEPTYEQEFYDLSYGFRPGRSPHQAIARLREQCHELNINWIIEAEVSGYFDAIPHKQWQDIIKQRVKDGGILRLSGKRMNAGVMEAGEVTRSDKGSPQGGVNSPMRANVYLHYVLEEWYEQEVKPRLSGRSFLIRFADDFIIGGELEQDGRRKMAVLPKRVERYGRSIHRDKSKLVRFGKPARTGPPSVRNETFDFLGYTHYWGKSRRGYWVVKRKTAGKRQRGTIKAIWQGCKEHRHQPIAEQYRMLSLKLRGHYQYYGIRSNQRQLENVAQKVRRAWWYWLNRRHSRREMDWEKFEKLLKRFPLPVPRIIHNI